MQLQPFLTAYDPTDLPGGSVDPLGFDRGYTWLAEKILPGLSNHVLPRGLTAHTLFNLIDRRHTRVSTAVSSNLKLSEWGKYLGDATRAAAILDRLSMRALRVDIDGPSYRQHEGRVRAKGHGLVAPDAPSAAAEASEVTAPATP